VGCLLSVHLPTQTQHSPWSNECCSAPVRISHTLTLPSFAPVKALAHRTSMTATSIDASLLSVSRGSPTRCESDAGGEEERCAESHSSDAGAGAGAAGGGGKPGHVRPASLPQDTDDASATAPAPEANDR
jgi:hypothetical protein